MLHVSRRNNIFQAMCSTFFSSLLEWCMKVKLSILALNMQSRCLPLISTRVYVAGTYWGEGRNNIFLVFSKKYTNTVGKVEEWKKTSLTFNRPNLLCKKWKTWYTRGYKASWSTIKWIHPSIENWKGKLETMLEQKYKIEKIT